MNNKSPHIIVKAFFFISILSLLFISCSPTKRLTSDKYLYNRVKYKFEDKRIDPVLFKRYERIVPNKRILGLRFHLFVYNLANPQKTKFPGSWFRKIGEAPVVYDSNLVKQNLENFNKYLSDIGYTASKVSDSIIYKPNNKVNVIYDFKLGTPIRINSFKYSFEDTSIRRYVFADTANALIKKGMMFNKQLMQAERLRIERLMKNEGFYKFSKEYIYYDVSYSNRQNYVNVTLNIKQNISGYYDPVSRVRPHIQYKIDTVTIIPDALGLESNSHFDTTIYKKFYILYNKGKVITPSTLVNACRIYPGKLYSQGDIDKTYSNLSAMGLFKFININLTDKATESKYGDINCKIDLAMRKRQSYTLELVGTNSDKDLGVRGNIMYNNYNIFKGGEHFQFGISGAYESFAHRTKTEGQQAPLKEIGFVSRLETPKFLIPFTSTDFKHRFSARTAFQFSYNNQRQQNFVRTIANTSFGYIWKGNSYNRHSIYPVDFSLVKLPYMDSTYFADNIRGRRIEYSWINHSILSLRYVFEFNTQNNENRSNYIYLRSSFESAGLAVNAVNKLTTWVPDSIFFGVQYSQYLRGEVDFRYFYVITPGNKLVYRLYGGIGIPYGNSRSMPFEKMFWMGGPYDIRAWNERTLGPGNNEDTLKTFNQLGEFKLEGNLEYRFKLFWKLEGALFSDAGNIWLLKADENRRSAFHLTDFYKDIAIGAGFGLRFDLSFVLLRTDFGFKLKDPARTDGEKWIFQNDNYRLRNGIIQFGIGYPF